jgi:hypothetical protein
LLEPGPSRERVFFVYPITDRERAWLQYFHSFTRNAHISNAKDQHGNAAIESPAQCQAAGHAMPLEKERLPNTSFLPE